jgi:TRAP transporter TAXI family solute receptor
MLTAVLAAPAAACDPREFARSHGATLRLSIAAGNLGGVFYPYAGAIASVVTAHVPRVAATAEVTNGSIDNMQFIRQGTADMAFATADMLDEAYRGVGPFASVGRIPVRVLANLYYSYLHIASIADTGLRTLPDLRGRVVGVGSAGSSTEVLAFRILRAAGLDPQRDLKPQNLSIGAAADALKDRKIDALVWIGGIPTAAILELATTGGRRISLMPCAHVLPDLQRQFGESIYVAQTIPAGAYRSVDADVPVLGLSNLLCADARMHDDLAYELTRALFEHSSELVAVHAEARHLTAEAAVKGAPIAYHPGAIRYYTERGVWTS